MPSIRSITIFLLGVLACQPVLSQTLPSCRSLASDADGDGYGWENDNSCVVTSTSLASPTFTNLETGNVVNLIRARWNPSDFSGKQITCTLYRFDDESYSSYAGVPPHSFQPLSATVPNNGNVIISGNPVTTQTWTIDNGIYYGPTVLGSSPWLEIIDYRRGIGEVNTSNAVRVWQTDELFTLCFTPNPYLALVPTGAPISDNNCDYSNAAVFDGWGWDPVSGNSCEPIDAHSTDNCDYANAAIFDGWGWDATTGQSCEPLAVSSDLVENQDCDYTNALVNENWGWNPVTRMSCPPL